MKIADTRRMSELARGFLIAAMSCFVMTVAYAVQARFLPIPAAPELGQLASALLTAHLITDWDDRHRKGKT